MNKQFKLSLLAASLVTAFAANVAQAGQIQASSVAIAREVITTNTQTIVAPSIAYRFAGDVDARVQAQTFQVQFTLQSGAWAAAPNADGNAISVSDGVDGTIQPQGPGATGVYVVDHVAMNGGAGVATTVYATITVKAGTLIKQPLISLNVASNNIEGATVNTAAKRGTIRNLFSVVGDLAADFAANGKCEDVKNLKVDFKHYTALSQPLALATEANATPDEHLRGGATNVATLVTFPTNVLPVVTTSTGNASIDPVAMHLRFKGSATAGAAPDAYVSTTIANLGLVSLKQNSTGYDSNLLNQYTLANGGAGISAVATAATNAGAVEASSLTATVTATNGFAPGGTLWLDSGANCATGIVSGAGVATAITNTNAAGPITLTIETAQLKAAMGAATGTAPVYVCYGVAGVSTPIPQSKFSTKAVLVKAAAGANLNEQNNSCAGTHYSLGGGVKIDVRNYVNSKDPNGWQSLIRLINNSETRAIDVWGQLIHPDGTYGPWGLLTKNENAGTANADKLAPRAVLNLYSSQVDARLTSDPAAGANNGQNKPIANAASVGSRLRITSNAGSTLRVQNYLYNPTTGNFIEASSTQGVDFEGNTDRAPQNEGQYQDQDAQAGLNGGR